MSPAKSVGDFLREWRRRRRLSQLDLAIQAGISARHLSFLETGRSLPSREMVLRLAEQLQLPLRERNVLLNAAGFASVFPERHLGDPGLEVVHKAIEVILKGHEPYPAIAIDRHWTLIASNGAFRPFLAGVKPELLQPPVNVLRLTLHPCGLGPRLANYHEWRSHVLEKLRHQIEVSGDPVLTELAGELRAYGAANEPQISSPPGDREWQRFAVPFQIVTEAGVLSFFSTTTIFGTPLDITLSELSLECFYPADAATGEALRKMQNSLATASR
jgi:transcriptional regulator with XRE-family HTH domain